MPLSQPPPVPPLPVPARTMTLFAAVRAIERANPQLPPVGASARVAEDAVRFAQPPLLSFPPGEISGFDGRRLTQQVIGLLGPSGPLPLNVTEYLHERTVQSGDHAPARFLDIFHHRLVSLFYRAWADGEPAVAHDRPDRDWFRGWLLGLGGGAGTGAAADDGGPDASERAALAGLLQSRARGIEGLQRLIALVCKVPVSVEAFIQSLVALEAEDRCRLGAPGASSALGSAVVGRNRHSRTDAVRVTLGPMGRERFQALSPGTPGYARLRWCLRTWLTQPLQAEVRWVLDGAEVPRTGLGGARLGRDTWMRSRTEPDRPADDLRVVVGTHAPHPSDRALAAPPEPRPAAPRPSPPPVDAAAIPLPAPMVAELAPPAVAELAPPPAPAVPPPVAAAALLSPEPPAEPLTPPPSDLDDEMVVLDDGPDPVPETP